MQLQKAWKRAAAFTLAVCFMAGFLLGIGVSVHVLAPRGEGGSTQASGAHAAPAPQTGDDNNAGLWIVLLIVAVLGLAGAWRIYTLHKAKKDIAQYDLPKPRVRVSFQPKDTPGAAPENDKE